MKRRLGKNGIPFKSVTTDRGSEFTATGRVFKGTPAKVKALQDKYNHRPRKSLGFLTPYEVAFNRRPRVGTRT